MLPELFAHQKRILADTCDLAAHAAFWEQGTGKTRFILETAEHLRRRGEIDAVFIFAPNIAHRQWIEDELPLWLPDAPWQGFFYTSGKARRKSEQKELMKALSVPYTLITMNYEAVMTPTAHHFMKKLFTKRKVLYVLDESTAIKSAGAKRTHRIVCSGRWCKYRRVLTGTPATNHPPFDIYKQLQFLDADFWKRHGFHTYEEFKTYFGVWGKGKAVDSKGHEYEYPRLLKDAAGVPMYRNLDRLHTLLADISSRVLKDEVFDLPPKLYTKQYFEMSDEQQRVYEEIRRSAMTFLSDGTLITVPLAITRLLRFQQVLSNYMPTDTGTESFTLIDKEHNPRLDCLVSVAEQVSHQAIVWARFHRDVDLIMNVLGDRAVRADGLVTGEQRSRALRRFKNGEVQFLVSNPACRGVSRGQNLQMARTVIYYNNTFSLEDRKQSEDRAHRKGTEHNVDIIDIVAPGTVDIQIVKSLRDNHDIASHITGDALKEWL